MILWLKISLHTSFVLSYKTLTLKNNMLPHVFVVRNAKSLIYIGLWLFYVFHISIVCIYANRLIPWRYNKDRRESFPCAKVLSKLPHVFSSTWPWAVLTELGYRSFFTIATLVEFQKNLANFSWKLLSRVSLGAIK